MLARIRSRVRRPSPAMLVACIALVVALGGTGYAAFKLPKNSVGTKQLKKRAVTTRKLKNGAVTLAKLRNGSVAMPKLAPGVVARLGQKAHRFWVDTNVGIPGGKVFDAPDFSINVRPPPPNGPIDYCVVEVVKKSTAASVAVNGSETTGPANGVATQTFLESHLLTKPGDTYGATFAGDQGADGGSGEGTFFLQSYGAGDSAHTYMVSASLFRFPNSLKCAAYGVVVPAS